MPVRSKQKTTFFCQECGYESVKWLGQCPACHNWNSFVEEKVSPSSAKRSAYHYASDAENRRENRPRPLSDISTETEDRLVTGLGELDRVLGGGIVQGSLMLIGGDPGIGKSTLLLQVCKNLCNSSHKVLYVSGEESLRQIALRAERIGSFSDSLEIFSETSLDRICEEIKKDKPECVVIDSIQTMCNEEISASPGSVSQVRETTGVLLRLAKENGISIFIVGHVTKEGAVAGPKVLEHIVDTVLYFEGEAKGTYRIIRSVKNRFGSTDEIGVFEMSEAGLKEVLNPSEFMLSGRPKGASGSVVACCMEGKRPLMVEIQALVCDSVFNIPRRQAMGTDYNRLNLLLAVLEKRVGLRISNLDAYLNIAGGMKINEPALDLAIIGACVSSYKNVVLDEEMVVFGEVGLSGEVRSVTGVELRINEASRLGFKRVVLPAAQLKGIKAPQGLELTGVRSVADLMEII
ncbi:MAG: DNA repair protein RadA [Lachnospiraceae bacterium]|nr:DNA repair protein RadA [Lachnospiraceae bacterium]